MAVARSSSTRAKGGSSTIVMTIAVGLVRPIRAVTRRRAWRRCSEDSRRTASMSLSGRTVVAAMVGGSSGRNRSLPPWRRWCPPGARPTTSSLVGGLDHPDAGNQPTGRCASLLRTTRLTVACLLGRPGDDPSVIAADSCPGLDRPPFVSLTASLFLWKTHPQDGERGYTKGRDRRCGGR